MNKKLLDFVWLFVYLLGQFGIVISEICPTIKVVLSIWYILVVLAAYTTLKYLFYD